MFQPDLKPERVIHLLRCVASQFFNRRAHKCVAPAGKVDSIGDAAGYSNGLAVDAFCFLQGHLGFFQLGHFPAQPHQPDDPAIGITQWHFDGVNPAGPPAVILHLFHFVQSRYAALDHSHIVRIEGIRHLLWKEVVIGFADNFALVRDADLGLQKGIGGQKACVRILYIHVVGQIVDQRAQQAPLLTAGGFGPAYLLFQPLLLRKISHQNQQRRLIFQTHNPSFKVA